MKQLLALFLARQPGEVAAAVRTTVAVTGVTTHPSAGNVLPSLATAQLNFRYLPGERQHTILLGRFAMDHSAFLRLLYSLVVWQEVPQRPLSLELNISVPQQWSFSPRGRFMLGVLPHVQQLRAEPFLGGTGPCLSGLAGEREDFAEGYVRAMLPKHADASTHMHARHEMASPVTPVSGSAFAIVHQAIQETLAGGRVGSLSRGLSS